MTAKLKRLRLPQLPHSRTLELSHFFALLLLLAPLFSHALTEGDYTYTTNAAGQATITDFKTSYTGALSITNTLGGCPVTSIDSFAFSSCTGLTSVTIPASVTSIGNWAFNNCTGLANITLTPLQLIQLYTPATP